MTVPDLIGDDCRLLFVGINPGLWTAATQTHFYHPSNRFYPALRVAGLVDWTPDTSVGITDAQREEFTEKGMAVTNLVSRATARASELNKQELASGGERLRGLVADLSPRVVAVAGVTAFRTAFARPKATLGRQDALLATAELLVVPNPSGLNAHETVDSLADWYSRSASAAGIL